MDRNIELGGVVVKDIASSTEQEQGSSRNSRSSNYFADRINTAWRKGSEAIIEVGRYLCEAREELDRDQFEALLKFKLDFDASVGRKLKRIGENTLLCAHGHKLPAHWTTIYELTKVDKDVLKVALCDGRVHPGMERKGAIALRKDDKGDGQGSEEPAEASTPAPSNAFLADWQAMTAEEKRAVLKHEGVGGLLELLKEDAVFLAKLYDRVIGLQVALASPVAASKSSKNLLTNLTGMLHWALGQDPASGVQALVMIKAKLAVNKRAPQDICFSFAKKAKR